jgi:ferredoxin
MSEPTTETTHETAEETAQTDATTTTHTVEVWEGDTRHEIEVEDGAVLRNALTENDLSPHGWASSTLNCQGQGHCGACTVDIEGDAPEPDQWLDGLLAQQDAGRLSCQMTVDRDLTVRIG